MIDPVELMTQMDAKREELRQQALKVLIDNQETYVAQWILQNPGKNIEDYTLEFKWLEGDNNGYHVKMIKIGESVNVQA